MPVAFVPHHLTSAHFPLSTTPFFFNQVQRCFIGFVLIPLFSPPMTFNWNFLRLPALPFEAPGLEVLHNFPFSFPPPSIPFLSFPPLKELFSYGGFFFFFFFYFLFFPCFFIVGFFLHPLVVDPGWYPPVKVFSLIDYFLLLYSVQSPPYHYRCLGSLCSPLGFSFPFCFSPWLCLS